MIGPYKAEFVHAMNQDIKELEQHGTCNIVSRKSVIGDHILPRNWAFNIKAFLMVEFGISRPDSFQGVIYKCREYITLKNIPLLYLRLQSDSCLYLA